MDNENPKYRYWIALGEHPQFSRDSNRIFSVFMDKVSNTAWALQDKFVESADINEVRKKLHAFVDERCDLVTHIKKLKVLNEVKKEKVASYAKQAVKPDAFIDSITVDEVAGATDDPTLPLDKFVSKTEFLMDLKDLV